MLRRPPSAAAAQAPKPSAGPHKTRECLPLILLLRNRLKYALTGKEVTSILMQRLVQVDGKVSTGGAAGPHLMWGIGQAAAVSKQRLAIAAAGAGVALLPAQRMPALLAAACVRPAALPACEGSLLTAHFLPAHLPARCAPTAPTPWASWMWWTSPRPVGALGALVGYVGS